MEAGRFVDEQGVQIDRYKVNVEQLPIATTYIPINYVLAAYIVKYKLVRPNLEVFVAQGNVKFVKERLLNYETDVGLLYKVIWGTRT